MSLVLGSLSHETLFVIEGNERRSDSVSELVGDDLHTPILEDSHTRVSSTQIDTNNWSFDCREVKRGTGDLPSFFLLGPQMNAKKHKDTKKSCFKHVWCFVM